MLQLKLPAGLELNLDGYTVIVPSICVGNAAQLACDILIITKNLKQVGQIIHPALIPLYGPPGYQHENKKATACEIYRNTEEKLLIIQFRSPLVSKFASKFHKYLAEFLKNAKRVVVLSGSFGFEKRIIEATPYEYKTTKNFKEMHTKTLELVGWKEYTGDKIYGSGNALQLYNALEERGIPVMLLFRYLLEGDNSSDAAMILKELSILCEDLLQLDGQKGNMKLTIPTSWNFLFGNDVISDSIF